MSLTDTKIPAAQTATRDDGPSWARAAFALTTVGWGANQFAPMVVLYRERMGISASAAEAVFGLYAAGLVPGLLVAGPLSDRVGRRPVVLFAVLLSMVSGGVLMLGSHGLAWLSVGRVLMGIASGSAFSAGSAWVKELSTARVISSPEPGAPGVRSRAAAGPPAGTRSGAAIGPPAGVRSAAAAGPLAGAKSAAAVGPLAGARSAAAAGASARRASIAMTIGFGLGPLVAGVLAQWGPAAFETPYLPQLVLAALALSLVARAPETVPRRRSRILTADLLRLRGFSDRRFVGVVLPMAPWVFGAATIAMVYVPGLAASHVKSISLAFAGAAAVIAAMSGVLIQPFARRIATADADRDGSRPLLLLLGLGLTAGGMLAEAAVAALGRLGVWQAVLALAVAVVVGFGYGVLLVFGLAEVQRLAPPEDLAAMTAVFQAFSYLGFAAPYLLSALKGAASPSMLLLVVAVLSVLTLAVTLRNARATAQSS